MRISIAITGSSLGLDYTQKGKKAINVELLLSCHSKAKKEAIIQLVHFIVFQYSIHHRY